MIISILGAALQFLASLLQLLVPETIHPRILYNVPYVRQTTDYSCGAVALKAVLHYYGKSFTEKELIQKLGADPEKGTRDYRMMEFAEKQGIKVTRKENSTFSDLQKSLNAGHPVILELQAWAKPEKNIQRDYSKEWAEGHYVVLVGLDYKKAYFMDPSTTQKHTWVTREDLEKRWHDEDGFTQARGHRVGLFFEGKPDFSASWEYME